MIFSNKSQHVWFGTRSPRICGFVRREKIRRSPKLFVFYLQYSWLEQWAYKKLVFRYRYIERRQCEKNRLQSKVQASDRTHVATVTAPHFGSSYLLHFFKINVSAWIVLCVILNMRKRKESRLNTRLTHCGRLNLTVELSLNAKTPGRLLSRWMIYFVLWAIKLIFIAVF